MTYPLQQLDFIYINGLKTPGIARVEPIAQSISWTDSQGYAFDGAVTRFQGNNLKEFSVRFQLVYLPDDLNKDAQDIVNLWRPFQALLAQPKPGTVAQPVNVSHPYFAFSDIRLAVTKSLKGPWYDMDTEKGVWVVEWEGKEYRTPKPLPARLTQPLVSPEGQDTAMSATAKATAALQADTKAKVAAQQAKKAAVPHS